MPVREEGQALGPCASLTKDREMAEDRLPGFLLAILSSLPSEDRPGGHLWCKSSPVSPHPSLGCCCCLYKVFQGDEAGKKVESTPCHRRLL